MSNQVKNVSTMNNSNCINTPNIATNVVSKRGKLHKITPLSNAEVSEYNLSLEKELEILKKLNRKVVAFLTEKNLHHEFQDFINSKTT